jgi:hypothetical protein
MIIIVINCTAPGPLSSSRKLYKLDEALIDHAPILEDIEYSTATTRSLRDFTLGVECGNVAAMRSCCAFSVFMFLSYLFQVALLFRFKDDILSSVPLNEDYSSVPTESASTDHEAISGEQKKRYDPRIRQK